MNNYNLRVRKKLILPLFIANCFLVCLGWVMAVYAYPRLPPEMPLWLNFYGQPALDMEKSLLFFIYPLTQTLFISCLAFISHSRFLRTQFQKINPSSPRTVPLLEKEFIAVVLIFFNLIFIHIQRSVILQAHGIEEGVSKLYFYSLFGIILLFIPYYRFRRKMMRTTPQNKP